MEETDGNFCPDCQELVEWLAQYIEGEMAAEAQRQLLLHIQTCHACAEMLRSMKRTVHYCHLQPSCEIPQTVHEELWVCIRREIRLGGEARP
jgi:anti-sigma factor RsiW